MTGKDQIGCSAGPVMVALWIVVIVGVTLILQHERGVMRHQINRLVERQDANIRRIEESAVARAALRESIVRLDERVKRLEGR